MCVHTHTQRVCLCMCTLICKHRVIGKGYTTRVGEATAMHGGGPGLALSLSQLPMWHAPRIVPSPGTHTKLEWPGGSWRRGVAWRWHLGYEETRIAADLNDLIIEAYDLQISGHGIMESCDPNTECAAYVGAGRSVSNGGHGRGADVGYGGSVQTQGGGGG